MSKKKKLIPELRFPEFKSEGEWESPNLSKISDVIMGSSPSSTSYNENKIGLPLLQGNADIKNRLSAPRIYTTEITKECEVGDILLSVRAPVGTVAKSLHNACIGRGISALRAKKPNSQEYLYQWLFSYESSWGKISQGGTFDAVNSDDIRNLLVPIPNPKEQQKIASCLSSLDEVISAHSQKLDLLKDHKKGLMQNLFPQEGEKVPKLRFKEFEKDGEWNFKKLNKLGNLLNGLTYSPDDVREEGLLVLRSSNVQNGLIDLNDSVYVRTDIQGANLLKPNDILICVRNGSKNLIGKNAIIPKGMPLSTHGAFMTVFRATNPEFVFQLFQTDFYDTQVKADLGATINSINGKNFLKYEFPVPENPKEQQKIALCLSSLDALITTQTEKIEQLNLHKKGLMQGLFPKIND